MMMSERYPLAALESVPADIREAMLKVQEKSGFVPNVFLKL
ncbi:MAG: alkylhydroperoxidase, partial [Betaproteobacteria bacterium]|nr:alkylhydroperoxidase [Betaproteobacteria bacterium]